MGTKARESQGWKPKTVWKVTCGYGEARRTVMVYDASKTNYENLLAARDEQARFLREGWEWAYILEATL